MFTNLLSIVYLLSTAVEMKTFPPQEDMNVNKFWGIEAMGMPPQNASAFLWNYSASDTCSCLHVWHNCCLCSCCWWEWGKVDLVYWNRRVAAAPTSAGDVLLHVVCVTPCLCGFNSSLRSVSGFCIWLCGSQRNFSRECILRKWHKKASSFDAKL